VVTVPPPPSGNAKSRKQGSNRFDRGQNLEVKGVTAKIQRTWELRRARDPVLGLNEHLGAGLRGSFAPDSIVKDRRYLTDNVSYLRLSDLKFVVND